MQRNAAQIPYPVRYIMPSRDIQQFYASIEALRKDLVESGDAASAERLASGRDGSTSGEVLQNLCFTLMYLKRSVSPVYHRRVQEALDFIESVLGPPAPGRSLGDRDTDA